MTMVRTLATAGVEDRDANAGRRPARRLRGALLAAGAAVALALTACVPVTNAPPGGGAVVTGTYRIGPFNLAAMGQPGWQSNASTTGVPRPPGSFGIKSIDFDIVDAGGTPVNAHDVHLHHVLLVDQAKPDYLCPGRGQRFAGAGMERTPLRLDDPYAVLVGASDRWDSLWHIMNMSDTAKTVYIQYKVGYQPGADASNTRGVVPFFMDITGCGNSEYDVPGNGGPGSVHTKSKTWTAPFDGIAVYAGGHIHAGGIDITLSDPNAGLQCTMTAEYMDMGMGMTAADDDGLGMLERIPPCRMHNMVFKDKPYTVTARYHNDQPVEGAMGIVLNYVWPGHQ
ncbi:MAG: hypothetical protein KJ056_04910 [Acidimicrobiia bacterium]|nr:hypothetical protein [Acidimicrobiia bacterium]